MILEDSGKGGGWKVEVVSAVDVELPDRSGSNIGMILAEKCGLVPRGRFQNDPQHVLSVAPSPLATGRR